MERKRLGKGSLLQVLFVLAVICQANALPVDVNIYSSTTIDSGEYGTINIYDTPPDQTIVDMTGGEITFCNVYDTTNLNVYNGIIHVISAYNNSTVDIEGGEGAGYVGGIGLEMHHNSSLTINNGIFDGMYLLDDSVAYIHGGVWSNGTDIDILIYDDSELHIYGKQLNHIDDFVLGVRILDAITGYWENDEEFIIVFSGPSADNFSLHEIPEPVSVLLFTFGGLLLRRTHK